MNMIVHKNLIEDAAHVEAVDCWCRPTILVNVEEMSMQEIETETLRQERIDAGWLLH